MHSHLPFIIPIIPTSEERVDWKGEVAVRFPCAVRLWGERVEISGPGHLERAADGYLPTGHRRQESEGILEGDVFLGED